MKKLIFIFVAMGCLSDYSVAQTLPAAWTAGSGGTAVDFEFRTDGTILGKGWLGLGSVSTSDTTDPSGGTKFLWYSGKGAFRGGHAGASQWADANIGDWSFAFGYGCVASQNGSVAFNNAASEGWNSFAAGDGAIAVGGHSFAFGLFSTTTADSAVALGYYDTAGNCGVALGTGNSAAAFGIAIGYTNYANAGYSTALGANTHADSYESMALGTYNVGGGNASSWVGTDPLLEVGNGTSSTAKADALVIYKNGNAKFSGSVQVPQSGDIPMYTGN